MPPEVGARECDGRSALPDLRARGIEFRLGENEIGGPELAEIDQFLHLLDDLLIQLDRVIQNVEFALAVENGVEGPVRAMAVSSSWVAMSHSVRVIAA